MPRSVPDLRTTQEVETSRDMTNYKPYRSKELKPQARAAATKHFGAWISPVLRLVRRRPNKQQEGRRWNA